MASKHNTRIQIINICMLSYSSLRGHFCFCFFKNKVSYPIYPWIQSPKTTECTESIYFFNWISRKMTTCKTQDDHFSRGAVENRLKGVKKWGSVSKWKQQFIPTHFTAHGAVILKWKISMATAAIIGISAVYSWHFKWKLHLGSYSHYCIKKFRYHLT